MKKSLLLKVAVFAGLMIVCSGFGRAETLFSYLDENGVRIFTNIPPKGPVQDLKMSGEPSPLPASETRGADGDTGTSYDQIIDKYAEEYRLDPQLIRSMIATESAFNPKAVSRKGAQGLMQLMPATALELGVEDPFDIEQNIDGGARYLRQMLDNFGGNVKVALAAYNAGPGAVERYGGRVPPYPETEQYVNRVLRFSEQTA